MNKITIRIVRQKEEHCGPASLEMLCSFYGLDISQEAIAQAAGISESIRTNGSRIDQLAIGVHVLLPDYDLLARYNASLADLRLLTDTFGLPVGVEWRALFVDSDGRYFEDGHYSVITGVDSDDDDGMMTIAEPDANAAFNGGTIDIQEFLQRWWDVNDIPVSSGTGGIEPIRNDRLLFVLVPASRVAELAPLGLERVSLGLMRKYRTVAKINGNHGNGSSSSHQRILTLPDRLSSEMQSSLD